MGYKNKSKDFELKMNILLPKISSSSLEAGLDEVGRGCLAGPVVAAAVILPENSHLTGLNDSKLLSPEQRNNLRSQILEQAIAWAIGECSHEEIDRINILNATFLAMHRALEKLSPQPEFIAVDGNKFPAYQSVPHACMVKGDSRYQHIAAASILAKTYRDELMLRWHDTYPMYGWNTNKGYPTQVHRNAVQVHGWSAIHRKSFKVR